MASFGFSRRQIALACSDEELQFDLRMQGAKMSPVAIKNSPWASHH
jgi:hypothetical protein